MTTMHRTVHKGQIAPVHRCFIRENYFVQFWRPQCRLKQVIYNLSTRVFDLISWFSLIPRALMQWHWAHLYVLMLHIKIFYWFQTHQNRFLGHVITLHQQLTTCKFCSWWEYKSNKITNKKREVVNRSRLCEYYLVKNWFTMNF